MRGEKASGGFGRDPNKRKTLYPQGVPDFSPAAPGHTGKLHQQVMRLGACYGAADDQPAFWAPVSTRRRVDGSLAVFPHFVFDRSKPGTVCVDQTGQRFILALGLYLAISQPKMLVNVLRHSVTRNK